MATKKVENLQYAEYLEILKFKKASRVHDCAETLGFAIDQNGKRSYIKFGFVNRGYAQCANGEGH